MQTENFRYRFKTEMFSSLLYCWRMSSKFFHLSNPYMTGTCTLSIYLDFLQQNDIIGSLLLFITYFKNYDTYSQYG